MQALAQLINYLFSAYLFILLLRFILQKLQASWYNPITKLIVNLTNPIIKVTRKIIPGFKGFDFSIIVVALLLEVVELYVVNWMRFGFTLDFSGILIMAICTLLIKLTYIFLFSVMICACLSWFTTPNHNALSDVTGTIAKPLLSVTQRYVSLSSTIDLSPVIVMGVLYLILIFILGPLSRVGLEMALA